MTPHEQEEVWRAAQSLVNSRATEAVLKALEEQFTAEWRNSAPGDEKTREQAYRMLKAVTAFRDHLKSLAAEPSVTQFNRRLNRG